MSQRVKLSKNPINSPGDFTVVAHDQVRSGDIYQGTRDTQKWYQNTEGQGCVDFWRKYYRPRVSSVQVTPDSRRRMSHVNTPPPGAAVHGGATVAPLAASQEREEDQASEGNKPIPSKTGVQVEHYEDHGNGFVSFYATVTVSSADFKEFILEQIQND